ncbi:MAG: oxidoreductase [Acidobacteriia bacterium]|nr:oxidoreductase [Terriglobia bacterium]
MSGRTALLAGGTGLVGSACMQALLEDDAYERVVVLARRDLPGPSSTKLMLVRFAPESLDSLALPAITDVFCALGTTIRKAGSQQVFRQVDFELPMAVARLGLRLGAKSFVLCSSVGADPASGNFYLRTKGELEHALQALPFSSLRILRPSILTGDRKDSRPGEAAGIWIGRLLQFIMVGPLRRYRPVAAQKVGKAMVASVSDGATQQGMTVYEYDAICRLSRKGEPN